MKEFKLKDESIIKYKDSLVESEYIALIQTSMDAYQYGIDERKDHLSFTKYNPIQLQKAFNRALMILCIEDYNEENYDTYFAEGVHNELKFEVENALDAWCTIENLVLNSTDVSVTISKFLSDVLLMLDKKLPEGDGIAKALKKLPKDWGKVFSDFKEITEPTKAEFDAKVEAGDYKDIK